VVVDRAVDLTLLGPLGCGIQTGAGFGPQRARINEAEKASNDGVVVKPVLLPARG